MNKQIFISLIDKFLAGRASEEEAEALVSYYHSFQDSDEWDEEELGDAKVLEARLLQRLNGVIRTEKAETTAIAIEDEGGPVRKRISWNKLLAAAGVIGIIVMGGYLLRDTLDNLLHPVKMVQVTTTKGTRKYIQLPDRSKIWLEGGSSFSYPEAFRGKERNVELTGEAFFEVAQDETHPFVIQTPLITTRVLGTSFNIEAYGSQKAEVVVVTGKVIVKEGGANIKKENAQQIVVQTNQKVSYDSSQRTLEMKNAPDAMDYMQRKEGKFIYRGAKVSEIIRDLQQAYDTPIAIKKEMLNCTFYGDFNAKDNVEKAVNLIAVTLNGEVKTDASGKGFLITGEGCH